MANDDAEIDSSLAGPCPSASIVIPIYNESESIELLVDEITRALEASHPDFQLICVDDGSIDDSFAQLERMHAEQPRLEVVQLRRNFGQTAALQAGIDRVRGPIVVLMDADLQNDPADIPAMIARLHEGYDLVAGWRKDRKDAFLSRKLPSMIANRLISTITGVRLHDYGCTLKVLRSDLARELNLYGEMHRFIPAAADHVGARIIEQAVHHRARQFGTTKYGIGRTTRVLLDLMVVRFQQSYAVRPMQLFGVAGSVVGLCGLAICAWLTYEKIALGTELAQRPLLLLGVLSVLVGGQLLSLGLMADMLSRTYHEAQGKKAYHVRREIGRSQE